MIVTVAIGGLLGAPNVVAQRNYDPKTVETIEGKVLSIEKTVPTNNRGHGQHLMLKTDKETIAVHLGPAWYLEKQTPHIAANDVVTVTGSRITFDGKPAIIASEVKKGNDVLKLRDENGIPVWSRGRGNR